jgi:hypothetical protein
LVSEKTKRRRLEINISNITGSNKAKKTFLLGEVENESQEEREARMTIAKRVRKEYYTHLKNGWSKWTTEEMLDHLERKGVSSY